MAKSFCNDNGGTFEDEVIRKKAVDKFYDVFTKGMDLKGARVDLSRIYVPCVLLVDKDGFYVSYSVSESDENGNPLYTDIISNKANWTAQYGNYAVTYRLDKKVTVTDTTGDTYTGFPNDAFSHFGSVQVLSFLNNDTSFNEEKNYTICRITEDAINYYIKTHNKYMNLDDREYQFTMPATDKDFEARLLNDASFIAFYQGYQKSTEKGHINIYAFSGSIEDKNRLYYRGMADGHEYYHEITCYHLTNISSSEGATRQEMASQGFEPCIDCVR